MNAEGDGVLGHDEHLSEVFAGTGVVTLFQPVVDLDTEEIAGFEALSRGPAGPLHRPADLFAAARRARRLPELDWLCRRSAIEAARQAGVRAPLSLLINAEPETLLADRADPRRWGEFADLRCYCEVTERALTRTPGQLSAAIDQVRAQDWGVALDDVGADPASLALLPLLQPDIIKLDLQLLHDRPDAPGDVRVARVVDAALTQAATTGAAVIAEGIETPWHLELARAYGVQYGQGYLLGRPASLPHALPDPRKSMPLVPRILDRAIDPGPFAIVASRMPMRSLTKAAVTELARQLLAQAGTLQPGPTVLVCSGDRLPPVLSGMVADMAVGTVEVPMVGVLGAPGTAPSSTALLDSDPARRDFAVAVLTAHFAGAVVARAAFNDPDRVIAALVMDRPLAIAAANAILTRL